MTDGLIFVIKRDSEHLPRMKAMQVMTGGETGRELRRNWPGIKQRGRAELHLDNMNSWLYGFS